MKNRSPCRTDAGELFTLAQAVMLSLNSKNTNPDTSVAIDAQGNQHQELGLHIKSDASTKKMDDLWFSVDMARTVNLYVVTISDEIAALPELQGMGNVASLRRASNDSAWRTFA